MLHTIAKINIIEGYSNKNLTWLSNIILDNYSKLLSNNPTNTRHEDSYCPQSLVGDEVIKEMSNFFFENEGLYLEPINYWGHVHERNMSTQEHCHFGGTPIPQVSAVLYLSAPEGSGEIVFRPKLNSLEPEFGLASFPAKTGTFYMFPSYLHHYVTRHASDERRVSFSVNYAIINPNTPQKQIEPVEPPSIVNPGNGRGRFP